MIYITVDQNYFKITMIQVTDAQIYLKIKCKRERYFEQREGKHAVIHKAEILIGISTKFEAEGGKK